MAARSVTARHSHEVVSRLVLSEQWPTAVVSEHTATTSVVTLAAVTQSTSTTILPIVLGSWHLCWVPQAIIQYSSLVIKQIFFSEIEFLQKLLLLDTETIEAHLSSWWYL